jgi:Xylose isomerase-like TIM barrel
MQRRDFIKQSSATLLALAAMNFDALAAKKKKNSILSLQLYSVRAEMAKDPAGTIKALGEMGYTDCEHAGYDAKKRQYYGYSPSDFKKLLADNNMTMQSGHSVFGKDHWNADKNELTDLWKTTVEDAVTAGQKYIISPWLDISLRKNFDDLKRFMDAFNICGTYCQQQGVRYGYHNHDFEFSLKLTSKRVYDIILENTDPNVVAQQLDIGNIPAEKGGHESAVLGTGVIGVQEVLKLGQKKGGTFYFIIEQESYQGKQPIDAMKENLALMKKWGY